MPVDADDPGDPELARIDELLAAVGRGDASDAEREELDMYAAEHPDLPARIEASARAGELGQGWLVRVESDERMQLHERTRTVRAERGVGLAMVLAGMALGFVSPAAGTVGILGGFVVLLYSFLRVRIKTHRDDPYKDVQR